MMQSFKWSSLVSAFELPLSLSFFAVYCKIFKILLFAVLKFCYVLYSMSRNLWLSETDARCSTHLTLLGTFSWMTLYMVLRHSLSRLFSALSIMYLAFVLIVVFNLILPEIMSWLNHLSEPMMTAVITNLLFRCSHFCRQCRLSFPYSFSIYLLRFPIQF